MFYSSRAVSLLLACATAITIGAFIHLAHGSRVIMVVGAAAGFVSVFMLTYFTLELLIFREIAKVYQVIEKIKTKDFKISKKVILRSQNPIVRLNSEIYNLASRKQQEIDELKRIENYRREFLADISHELKTPVFAAQGFIQTLIEGAVDDMNVRDRFLEKAAKNLDNLNVLVEDLIVLSQMEIGAVQMKPELVLLPNLVYEVFDRLEKKAASKQITMQLEAKNEKIIYVWVDAQRLMQAISNLVENAIKYGYEGGKVLVILDSEKEYWAIEIKDNGPGIESEHHSRIFERFYRIEKSRSKDLGGSGLGLAIVRQIIEAHNSKIQIQSKMGKGTSFIFKLKKAKYA